MSIMLSSYPLQINRVRGYIVAFIARFYTSLQTFTGIK